MLVPLKVFVSIKSAPASKYAWTIHCNNFTQDTNVQLFELKTNHKWFCEKIIPLNGVTF